MLALKVIEAWLKRWWWAIALPLFLIIFIGVVFDMRILMAACMIMMVLYPALLLGAYAFILSHTQKRNERKNKQR